MTSPVAFVDANTAPIAGVAPPQSGLEARSLPPQQRSGVLTDLAFLTAHSEFDGHSPIHRGVFIRSNVLCSPPPPPPPGVDVQSPDIDPNLSTRERFELHREDPSCAGCHEYFDDLGMGFEHYGAIGEYRDAESGVPVDASGLLIEYDEQARRDFYGAVELGALIADSPEATACFLNKWFQYASGSGVGEPNLCERDDLYREFEQAGFSIRTLLLGLVTTPSFLSRPNVEVPQCDDWE